MLARFWTWVRDVTYFLLLFGPIAVLSVVPGRVLATGQGSELLDNIVQIRPNIYLPLIAIPYTFVMFFTAGRWCLRGLPGLSVSACVQRFIQRFALEICCLVGVVATAIAFFPVYGYQEWFRGGAQEPIARFAYVAGMCFVVVQLIWIYTARRSRNQQPRIQFGVDAGSRLLYFMVVSGLYLCGPANGERVSAVILFELLALLIALMLPSARTPFVHEEITTPETTTLCRPAASIFTRSYRVSTVAAICVIVAFAIAPSPVGVWLGTLLVFYAGIGAWSVILSFAWSELLTGTFRAAKVIGIVLAVTVLALYTNHNSRADHVNLADGIGHAQMNARGTTRLADDYDTWNRETGAPTQPTIIVLAEGGGIRAAYWTAEALRALSLPRTGLINRTYAVIGVSGGSLGAASYMSNAVATQRAWDKNPNIFKDVVNASALAGNMSTTALSKDFLGPWLARLMSTELVQKIVPVRVFSSKGEVLQQSWGDALKCDFDPYVRFSPSTVEKVCEEDSRIINAPIAELPKTIDGKVLPRLLFVATHVESGSRLIFSSVNFPAADFPRSILMENLAPDTVGLLAAAHASARFPLVSPPGVVQDSQGRPFGRVVDGGYVDASGALTATQLVEDLERTHPADFHPVIIDLRNEPGDDPEKRLAQSMREGHVGELETVATTIAATNENSSYFVKTGLRREVCQHGGGYVTLKVRANQDGPIGLGWTLSQAAQRNLSWAIDRETRGFSGTFNGDVRTPQDAMQRLLKKAADNCSAEADVF
jgi:hypothetical protein